MNRRVPESEPLLTPAEVRALLAGIPQDGSTP
jgi:hypothetical protein